MTASITEQIIDELGGYEALSAPLPEVGRAIKTDQVDALTDTIMTLVADLVATLIDAGSEREAVEENDALRTAIRDEFAGWTA